MNGPCRSQDTVIYRDTCFVGIKEVSIASSFVNIFPNPLHSSSILQIINPSFFQAELKIYNVLGGEVKRQKITSQTTVINRDGMADGIYLFRVINERGESMGGKFVVE
jgi:hypothetical protein